MTLKLNNISVSDFLEGFDLSDAIYEFGDPALLQKIQDEKALTSSAMNKATNTQGNMTDILAGALSGFAQQGQSQGNIKNVTTALKADLLKQIKSGELRLYGFQLPRDINNRPILIPIDLILSGDLNWDNNSLNSQGIDFAGIKVIHLNVLNKEDNSKLNKDIKPAIKEPQNLADLDPDQLIDEKRVAQYLGISPRTLQGYRTKGGGPEFIKLSHNGIIRYKPADLIAWTNKNKKRNTSE